MSAPTLERYLPRSSPVHALDPRVKVVVTLLLILSNALLPDGAWLAFALTWGLILGSAALAQIKPLIILRRGLVVLPFLLAAVTVIFTIPGTAVFQLNLGPWQLVATRPGLIRFASILFRSWLSVQAVVLLTAATPFPDLMHALHHLRLPGVLVNVISFMYRYLFVLVEEAMRLSRARAARSARREKGGGGSIWWRAKVTGSMVGQLFIRSLARSERVYDAMAARGYQGQLLTMNPHVMERGDWVTAVVALLLILSLQLLARL
jgi:cobalt/nickel transport system permease protein